MVVGGNALGTLRLTMKSNLGYTSGLLVMMASCNYSFDKAVALKEFKEVKPNCAIIKMTDYECDGTLGECWYVEFKYDCSDSPGQRDTTFQYWNVDGKWLTRKQFDGQRTK